MVWSVEAWTRGPQEARLIRLLIKSFGKLGESGVPIAKPGGLFPAELLVICPGTWGTS